MLPQEDEEDKEGALIEFDGLRCLGKVIRPRTVTAGLEEGKKPLPSNTYSCAYVLLEGWGPGPGPGCRVGFEVGGGLGEDAGSFDGDGTPFGVALIELDGVRCEDKVDFPERGATGCEEGFGNTDEEK